MTNITKITTAQELNKFASLETIVDFLHHHLGKFRDDKTAITKAIEYIFSAPDGGKGFLMIATADSEIVGCLVMNCTGMDEYIPANILVYIAVHEDKRGMGIGKLIIQAAQKEVTGGIALHVEYDNPAQNLYKRLGFSSKYAEMRWTGN